MFTVCYNVPFEFCLTHKLLRYCDMSAHLRTLQTQDAMLTRRLGANAVGETTYETLLFEVTEYATTLDDRYAKSQKTRR